VKRRGKKIKLLLVDDHPIVREGLKSHLAAQDDLEVVGDASNGLEAIDKARLRQKRHPQSTKR
jgi:DNA-binding NarL/FixJ family response regulator